MQTIPTYISVFFISTAILSLYFLFKIFNNSKKILIIAFCWLIVQAVLSSTGFYLKFSVFPPRFLLALLLPVLAIIFLLVKNKQKNLNATCLTLVHIVRIPVEITLLLLSVYKVIPSSMTFEGLNFDILSGLSAPIVYYLFFVKQKISSKTFIIWNCLCLALVINVIVIGILSAPLPFQQFSFNQPNIAVFHFPYIWLPSFVVPLVIFSHIATVIQQVKLVNKL